MSDIATEIDASTGTVIERPLTPAEIEQREQDQLAAAQAAQAAAVAQAAVDAAVASAVGKLRALGLTDDEIAALNMSGPIPAEA